MIALLVITFILYALGLVVFLFLPKEHFQKFFEMENLPDATYRDKRKIYGNVFLYIGMVVVEGMIMIAKSGS